MLHRTDCDVRLAAHARRIAVVNEVAWMRPTTTEMSRIQPRQWLSRVLVNLGASIVPGSSIAPTTSAPVAAPPRS